MHGIFAGRFSFRSVASKRCPKLENEADQRAGGGILIIILAIVITLAKIEHDS